MTPSEAFFTVHRDLPREGPGLPEDVTWALDVAGTKGQVRILDAASGPGADAVTLAEARAQATIEAIDLQPHFAAEAARRLAPFGDRATARQGDYTDLQGRYDLIWCAGAMYFKGFPKVLDIWRDHLAGGGAVAFSEPCFVTDPPTPEARTFWEGEGDILHVPQITNQLTSAKWKILGHRLLMGAPWAAYYAPMEQRLNALDASDPATAKAIEDERREIALWRAIPEQIAYALFVVTPA